MKFHSIRIQNYKSINDITLYLSDVNLLIGPNNSGKSNILSALKLFADRISLKEYPEYLADSNFATVNLFEQTKNKEKYSEINFTATFISEDSKYYIFRTSLIPNFDRNQPNVFQLFCIYSFESDIQFLNLDEIVEKSEYLELDSDLDGIYILNGQRWKLKKELFRIQTSNIFRRDVVISNKSEINFNFQLTNMFNNFLVNTFYPSSIYSIQVEKLKLPAQLKVNEESVFPDGSNLVSFIDSMRDTKPKVIQEIEKDLFLFTKEFNSIRLFNVTPVGNSITLKKLGLADKDDNTFWSDQLSEGVLYFLALLAIIHQPDPPHLLMLEEPEKGIHPRRIKEIIELIFYLAKEKGIRVILTTHSPYVVDEFSDVPEGVHIIDKVDKATQVKNLKLDFIDKEADREDKIDYLSSLGEHWSIGFLGGVPE